MIPREDSGRRLDVATAIRGVVQSPAGRIWLLSVLFAAPAAVLSTRLAGVHALLSPTVAWWALALIFFVTERTVLAPPGTARSLPSVGVGAGVLVVGVFYATPLAVLAALCVGFTAAMVTRRPLLVAPGVYGLAQYAFFAAAALTIFQPLATGPEHAWQAWAAAGGAAVLVAVGRGAALAATVADRQALRALRDDVGVACLVTVASTCFGLLAVVLSRVDPTALVLICLTGASTLAVYRLMARERQRRVAVEFLHGAGDALQGPRELETAVVQLLRRARSMFSAELAQLTIFPTAAGEKALRTTVGHGFEEVMAPLDLSQMDDVLEADTDGVIIDRRTSPSASEMLLRRGVGEAMVALLRGHSRMLGSLLVGGHVDARPFESRDLQLFQTLAIQTTTTLENGRLERSIARLSELQEQLTHQAFHDSLTDLANRSLFGERIDQALARSAAAGRLVAVIFIDLDDFKAVNDTLGHAAGDALLIGVAERLRGCLRRPDTAARLGGDEFAVLLEDLNEPSEADIVARRIFDALKSPFDVIGQTVCARASLGVAVADAGGDTASNLMRHADVAMYAAKAAGKDRFVLFAPGMEAEIVSRHRLRSELDRALASDQLTVRYQPVVDLTSGEVTGVEALVRWQHPQRGLIGPADFIPLAEETGQILQIGDYVLRRSCADTASWRSRHAAAGALTVSVNISALQLQQPMFVESVVETVRASGLRQGSVVLELTESILVDDAATVVAKLDVLRRAGIGIAIDDFGTGYSSLSYLRRLPVDTLKIAKPFVDDLAADEPSGDFARAIVGIGTALRLGLVAEGIESAEQIAHLRELGCTHGQGFYLSHPVSARDIDELLAQGGSIDVPAGVEPVRAQVIQLRRQ